MSHAQRDWLACIDFRLYFFGEIGRPDLIGWFGVALAGGTRDLALYREIVPQNIAFDDGWDFKIYVLGMMLYHFISESLTSYSTKRNAAQAVPNATLLASSNGVSG